MTAIRITIIRTAGSVPREAGTTMIVRAADITGTIGGGALEWQAMARARRMLAKAGTEAEVVTESTVPLGPALGQCCGGSVTLRWERIDDPPGRAPMGAPLWIWGAGHVGRALAAVCAALPDRSVTLIDTSQMRLPGVAGLVITPVVAADMPALVPFAPPGADHLIVTYCHQIDLRLCDALLRHDCASIGLIGSATKWARFRNRLSAIGHTAADIGRIACPIGDPALGKHPQQIAIGVAAALIAGRDAHRREVAS